MTQKIKVAVLMGGPSSEHEVSLKTGEMILKNLDKTKFETEAIKIAKDGSWPTSSAEGDSVSRRPITMEELKNNFDIAFIALHGAYGEDGQVQNILETFKIPYTGSGPIASALAMNKQKTALVLRKNGLLVPNSLMVDSEDPYIEWAVNKNFKYPIVIKPIDQGSSVGVSVIHLPSKLNQALENAFQHSNWAMAQNYIPGQEITCGVLEINNVPIPLAPTEIIPKISKFFDYYAKYNFNGSTEITPPALPSKTIKNIQMLALKTHKILGCSGMSRTDMILDKNGNLYILELNTIPGMTETSILPQQAAKMGIGFPQLLEIIIHSGLQKHFL